MLPQQSLGSSSEPRSSKSETTSVSPLQAATWRAVRPSLSLKLTLTPESNSSLIPSRSPSFAEYISLTSGSIGLSTSSISSTAAAAAASCFSGAIDDCFPNVNLTAAFVSIATNLCLACGENFLELEFEV